MIKLSCQLTGSVPSDSNIVVFSFEKGKRPVGSYLFGSSVEKAYELAKEDGFVGKQNQLASVRPRDRKFSRYIFVGLGKENEATADNLRRGTATVSRWSQSIQLKNLYVRPPQLGTTHESAQAVAEGALLGSYRYTKYKSSPSEKFSLQNLVVLAKDTSEQKLVQAGLKRGEIFGNAVCFARDIINQPPSDTTPTHLVSIARQISKDSIQLKVFNKQQLGKMGMGGLLGVNRGSAQPPYFLHLTYRPSGKAKKKIGVCGKGITFDSGGLSLKPAKSMETMKYDMSGAATVLALFKALAQLKPNVEVHGFAPLTENMPGSRAIKPGDVFKALNGKTVEVLNTDAEGRLILADALSYAGLQNLDEVFDIATLTGACIVALGNQIAGLMGNNPAFMEKFKTAAAQSGEKVWELPLEKEYENLIKSPIADLKNIGPMGEAGTILAGLFLKEFVPHGLPWVHIDIASSAWTNGPSTLSDTGSTGVMIRSLLHYITTQN